MFAVVIVKIINYKTNKIRGAWNRKHVVWISENADTHSALDRKECQVTPPRVQIEWEF